MSLRATAHIPKVVNDAKDLEAAHLPLNTETVQLTMKHSDFVRLIDVLDDVRDLLTQMKKSTIDLQRLPITITGYTTPDGLVRTAVHHPRVAVKLDGALSASRGT